MTASKIVDNTGRELHPGLVVRWLLNGSPFEGEIRVIRANGDLLCTGGQWKTRDGVLGFTTDWIDRPVNATDVTVIGWNDPGNQYSWYRPDGAVENRRS